MNDTKNSKAAFEAWAASIGLCVTGKYTETIAVLCAKSAFKAGYQAGRAAGIRDGRTDAYVSASRMEQMREDGL